MRLIILTRLQSLNNQQTTSVNTFASLQTKNPLSYRRVDFCSKLIPGFAYHVDAFKQTASSSLHLSSFAPGPSSTRTHCNSNSNHSHNLHLSRESRFLASDFWNYSATPLLHSQIERLHTMHPQTHFLIVSSLFTFSYICKTYFRFFLWQYNDF